MTLDPRKKARKPPTRHPIGSSSVNASDLKGLRTAWQHELLVLFLGAGVSLPHGIPTWKNLLLEMLFDQTQHAQRMRGLFPHYRRALSAWLADSLEYNPVILARMIEDDIRSRAKKSGNPSKEDPFHICLRSHLYSTYRPSQEPTTLTAIADFIAASEGKLPAIVTFNFDDLLEEQLTARNIQHLPVFTAERRNHGQLPIIHPHGYIPREGVLHTSKIVFTERDYHALSETMFHWALTEIVHHLRHHTVLFIGLSMSDPSLRRLLDACRNSHIPAHWQVKKRHEIRPDQRGEILEKIELSAAEWGRKLGSSGQAKDQYELVSVIESTLKQADTYDRELFEKMGVKTIWLDDHSDIRHLLKEITRPQPTSKRSKASQ